MASIREHVSKTGRSTYKVLYRHDGRQASDSFDSFAAANEFRTLLNLGWDPERAQQALGYEPPPATVVTVAELAERYLEWKARDVTERTMTQYRRDVTNYILPTFGHRAAEDVNEADVQRWVDTMAKTLSPKSVADRHMLLHSMYQYGRRKSRGLVSHNPCQETELPKRKKRGAPKGTTVPEFVAILDAAAKRNPDAADLILFLGETGWRFSEATALTVRDVEDDGVDVWVTVTQVTRIDGHGRQVLAEDEAKSQAAFRRIRLFPDSAAMIRRRLVGKGLDELVLTNSKDRQWNQNTFLRETWPKIIADAQLGDRRPTPHWLRHMHVAVCAASGIPMHEIQRRIGHEHYGTTVDVYGTMIGDVSDESMDRAAAIMAGRRHAPGIAPMVRGEVVQGEIAS